MLKYKIIQATDIDRLELLVNEFFKKHGSQFADFVGTPQVFGHESYIQAVTYEELSQ